MVVVRRSCREDLPILLAVYNHYVTETAITFDTVPRTLAQREAWFSQFASNGRYQCFTAVTSSEPIGWACSTRLKEKAAYDCAVETSIYLNHKACGHGIGKGLYGILFDALASEDVHRAYAAITLPNNASLALHRSFGFQTIGRQTEVGFKFGRYWDVELLERAAPA